MSIFVDLETGRILYAVEGKGGEYITPFLKVLGREVRKQGAVELDMRAPFISAVEKHLPQGLLPHEQTRRIIYFSCSL